MKSTVIRLGCIIALSWAMTVPLNASEVVPVRSWALDSLAKDISTLGYVPSGGQFHVLAASRGWFGPVSRVMVLPMDSPELQRLLGDDSVRDSYFGAAPWLSGMDLVLVLAPPPTCWPDGVSPSVTEGSTVEFRLEGFGQLTKPEVAVGTPELDVLDLLPDSSGVIRFQCTTRGIYWVEVMQHTPQGPSVELLFPVVAGGSTEDVFTGAISPPGSTAGSPEEIMEELNRIRSDRGVPPLSRSGILDSIAADRAGNLAISGEVNHIDRVAGSLQQLLPANVGAYGENIGKGEGFQEAWSMILISPFHLRTCLSERYTNAGIGGAADCSSYEWQLVLVQVFSDGTVP